MKNILDIINEELAEMSGYLNLQRCQAGEVNDVWDFNVVNGQNGEGIYAYLAGDRAMKDYYCKNGENVHSFKVPKKYVIDLSKQHLDYWGVKKFMYDNPQYKVFIFSHNGHGIPTSKEVLITDPNIIQLNQIFESDEEMGNYSKDTIYNDVANFVKKNNYGSLINSQELSKGMCDTIMKKLYEYLLSLGYDDNKLLAVDLLNPKFDTTESHPEWQKFDKKYLVHTMLQVGDFFVDLTGSQYSQSQAGIKVYTKQELGSLWGNYKIMKKDAEGRYIGGTFSNAKLKKF